MGWARFDPPLTPIVAQVLSPEYKFQKAAGGALKFAAITAAGLPLAAAWSPLASGAHRDREYHPRPAQSERRHLTTAAVKNISAAVTTYGYSPVTATILGETGLHLLLESRPPISGRYRNHGCRRDAGRRTRASLLLATRSPWRWQKREPE